MNSLRTALSQAREALAAAGIDSAAAEAQMLTAHVLGISSSELKKRLIFNENLNDDAAASLQQLITDRATRKPLQHITGKAPFRFQELSVGPGVFIPRPETETVVAAAIDYLNAKLSKNSNQQNRDSNAISTGNATSGSQQNPAPPLIAVDLCTGSGAIAIAIATECPGVEVYAVELEELAHSWAQQNVQALAPHILLSKGDARTALSHLDGQVDLVISNPPYLASHEIPPAAEARDYDPRSALYGGGADGLVVPGGIVNAAVRLLKPGGLLVMEHGDTQSAPLAALIKATQAFTDIQPHRDLNQRNRFITAVRA